MLIDLLHRLRFRRISSGPDFIAFLERNAWLVAQKTVIGYCAVKTNLPVQELAKDKPFEEAYDASIRHAYAATLADLLEIAAAYLRPYVRGRENELATRFAQIYESLLTAQTAPTRAPDAGWSAEISAFRARIHLAARQPAKSIRDISLVSAERIVATLPIHERLSASDAPAIIASVQFVMVGRAHEFERIDLASVAADLLPASAD